MQRNWQERSCETNLTPPRELGTDQHPKQATLCCLFAVTASLCVVSASQLRLPSISALFLLLARNWGLLAFGKNLWNLALTQRYLLSKNMTSLQALRSDCVSSVSLAPRCYCGSLLPLFAKDLSINFSSWALITKEIDLWSLPCVSKFSKWPFKPIL